MLKFRIEGQKLTWENPDEVVVAGTKKYLECYFEFDGDAWSGFEYIEAFFKNGRDKPIRMLLSANRIWKEDGLCLTAGDWSVYLRAVVSKKKVDEGGNVIYEEDGVTPVMELERQMTSSSVSIRVLAHGQFENAQNSFESPEIAEQYIEQMLDIGNAMSVFEEYDPKKEYFKHNRVTFEGASYVLIAESAQGINPTDTGSWLCIAEKGDKGSEYFGFPDINIDVGAEILITFEWDNMNKDDYPGVDNWRVGDMLISTNGKILKLSSVIRSGTDVKWVTVLCVAYIKGDKGDKGDDANVDKNTLVYRDEVSVLPETAKTGDVYKIAEAIYEEGMYYIPMDMGDIGESDGIIRYYFDSVFGSYVIDVVTQMVEDGKINNFALFDGDVRFDIPLAGAGYDNGFYIGSTKETYDYIGHHFKYILVPSEYGDDFFYGRNAVKFHKGELVVFTDKGWVSADAEMLKNIRYDLDDFKTEIGERFNSNDEFYATINLENVSNEDFKRKAEEAGVGGDAGLAEEKCIMEFKGVVSELPDTANEGEVYKLITGAVKFELYRSGIEQAVDNFILGSTNVQLQKYGDEMPEIATIIEEAIAKSGGAPATVKLVLPEVETEAVYTFTRDTYSYEDYSEDGGPKIWTFWGNRTELIGTEFVYGPCDVYSSEKIEKICIRFGGEWV